VDVFSIVKVNGIDFKESGGLFETDVGRVGIGEVISVGTEGVLTQQAAALQQPEKPELDQPAQPAKELLINRVVE
jgi:hypothetical protein